MTDPIRIERLVHELATIIDADEPPGLAAHQLAKAVVSLVKDRESPQAILLTDMLNRLHPLFKRWESVCPNEAEIDEQEGVDARIDELIEDMDPRS